MDTGSKFGLQSIQVGAVFALQELAAGGAHVQTILHDAKRGRLLVVWIIAGFRYIDQIGANPVNARRYAVFGAQPLIWMRCHFKVLATG